MGPEKRIIVYFHFGVDFFGHGCPLYVLLSLKSGRNTGKFDLRDSISYQLATHIRKNATKEEQFWFLIENHKV